MDEKNKDLPAEEQPEVVLDETALEQAAAGSSSYANAGIIAVQPGDTRGIIAVQPGETKGIIAVKPAGH